ncbi:MAG: sigma-54 dependent transcriptional regulator [Desulfarculus sp.]|nr:sigma-54 dependent transcriptional regulator [Pseudomonadota bacterium]MBU4576862.1 sigma-54 dependent transcriptional regulator [Pseudomonadota bacterium]MBU4600146.1 sigma-54 dependent transcriptional regulator [Pseudomonadota bacterium]MBV1715610.1 sigma-54 dependent transcriptional regulator [Desulfarculus sp.]MBV1738858.1 sigma-54 dependent transcriptional regulator [Desulfarculus sp.]
MSTPLQVLVVDDELAMRESIAAWLIQDGQQAAKAEGGREALAMMEEREFDLALVDIKMPGMDGIELLRRIKEGHPDTLVIIITAYGSIESAVEAMKAGASDYLLKPFDPEHLMLLLEKMGRQRRLMQENQMLRQRLAEGQMAGFEDMVGSSPDMFKVFDQIEEVAATEAPVLIVGETGTGKELVARAIHNRSARSFGPFVAINCGAQSESLLESELFGHERGAFTGAVKARRGRLEMADGGTLFLDEVGEISQKMQVALLRVLEDGSFLRVGGGQPLTSDFRLICATHRNLPELISAGEFRQDFYYRINVFSVSVPPLRRRREDVVPLAEHFIAVFAQETGKAPPGLEDKARRALISYSWPGNVRELRNIMERAVIVSKSGYIGLEQLTFLDEGPKPGSTALSLAEMETEHIRRVLTAHGWNITQAAATLGIDRTTLGRKIKKAGLRSP